jgi:hypothetical protein
MGVADDAGGTSLRLLGMQSLVATATTGVGMSERGSCCRTVVVLCCVMFGFRQEGSMSLKTLGIHCYVRVKYI